MAQIAAKYTDYASQSPKKWVSIFEEHKKSCDECPIVSELLLDLDHEMKEKLFFDILETVENFLFSDIMEEYWSKVGLQSKTELMLCVADFVKANCKYFKVAEIVKKLSREFEYADGVGLLAFFRHYCKSDHRSSFVLAIEELERHLSSNNLQNMHELYQDTEKMLCKIRDNPTYTTFGNILSASISASFYSVAFKYHFENKNYEESYHSVRLYLQYKDILTMTNEERIEAAVILMLSCLASESMFAFGEVVEQNLIVWLTKTEDSSLSKYNEGMILTRIMKSFDQANLKDFEAIMHELSSNGNFELTHQLMKSNKNLLELKFRLMTLLNICTSKPRGCQVVTFDEVSDATGITNPITLQRLFITAMGKKLIFGTIDSAERTIKITKTHPQAINLQRAVNMAEKYDELISRADQIHQFMNDIGGKNLLNSVTL